MAARALLFGLCFAAFQQLPGLLQLPMLNITPLWPSGAFLFAVLLLAPPRTWPWYLSAAVLAYSAVTYINPTIDYAARVVYMLCASCGYLLAALTMRRASAGTPLL